MKPSGLLLLVLLTGCHQKTRIRLGSPEIQHAPEITCIVFVQGDKISVELAKAAIEACKKERPAA